MKKMSQALDKIEEGSSKVTENGKILINVPSEVNKSEVKEILMSTFFGNFCLDDYQ